VTTGRVLADDDDPLHGRELRRHRVEHREQLLADDEHGRLRVVDDERGLGRREPPVDRAKDSSELRRAEHGVHELGRVAVEVRDAILRPDALGSEAVGEPIGPLVELPVRDRAFAVDDGGNASSRPAVLPHDVRDGAHPHGCRPRPLP